MKASGGLLAPTVDPALIIGIAAAAVHIMVAIMVIACCISSLLFVEEAAHASIP